MRSTKVARDQIISPSSDGGTANDGSDTRWFHRLDSPALFLTFDDGPNPEVTPSLLDLLGSYRATATFFVTGESLNHAISRENLVSTIDRGHTVGNHGLIHLRGTCPRFDQMRDLIASVCRVDTQLLRSPYGSRTLLKRYFAEVPDSIAFHWTHDFADWLPIDINNINHQLPILLGLGNIILLHDGAVKDATYRDRRQVLKLTELICSYCEANRIPLEGLASVFPHHHQRI